MGRPATHTQEELVAAAQRLASAGQAVTASALRAELGNKGSYSTLQRFSNEWAGNSLPAATADSAVSIPDAVRTQMGLLWSQAMKDAATSWQTDRELYSTEIERLKKSATEAYEITDSVQSQLEDAQDANKAAAGQVAELSEKLSRASEEIASLKGQLSSANEQLKDAKEEREQQAKRLSESAVTISTLNRQLEESRTRLSEAEQAKQEAHAGLADARAQLQASNEQAQVLQKQLDELRSECATKDAQVAQLHKTTAEQQQAKAGVDSLLASAEAMLKEAQAEAKASVIAEAELKGRNQQMQAELEGLKQLLATKLKN